MCNQCSLSKRNFLCSYANDWQHQCAFLLWLSEPARVCSCTQITFICSMKRKLPSPRGVPLKKGKEMDFRQLAEKQIWEDAIFRETFLIISTLSVQNWLKTSLGERFAMDALLNNHLQNQLGKAKLLCLNVYRAGWTKIGVLHFLDYTYTPVNWSAIIYKCELKVLGKWSKKRITLPPPEHHFIVYLSSTM